MIQPQGNDAHLVVENRDQLRPRFPVPVQEIGNTYFLEIGDNLLSVDDLARYRKVYIANNRYIYVLNIVFGVLILVTSIFTLNWTIIVPCAFYFISTIAFYYSFTLVSTKYMAVALSAFAVGLVSFVADMFILPRINSAARGLLALEHIIIFFIFSYLIYCATRIQTILKIVPSNRTASCQY